jgi:hypothetical protein
MTEIEKIRSADYVENMLAESENQDRRDEKLILVWFLLLALAIFANRFTDGDFQYVIEGLGIIGFVGYFLTK